MTALKTAAGWLGIATAVTAMLVLGGCDWNTASEVNARCSEWREMIAYYRSAGSRGPFTGPKLLEVCVLKERPLHARPE